jgi:hypothetical protein
MAASGHATDHLTHRGSRAIRRLVAFAPATGGLALWVRHRDVGAPPCSEAGKAPAPPLTTDGTTLAYTPDFDRLTLDEQAGRVAQATLHVALRHAARFDAMSARSAAPIDRELFDACAEAIVNSSLAGAGWLRLPADAILLAHLLPHATSRDADPTDDEALAAWDVERLYRAIDDRRMTDEDRPGSRRRSGRSDGSEDGKAAGKGEAGKGAGGAPDAGSDADGPRAANARARLRQSGTILRAPTAGAAGGTPTPEADAAATRAWASRLERAHAEDGAFSMLRGVLASGGPAAASGRTPWEQILRTRLARALAPKPALSWSRPSRSWLASRGRVGGAHGSGRMPWEPGRTASTPTPRLAVVVDVSGSIEDGLLARFASEIAAIARRTGAAVTLVVGDDRVRHVAELRPGRVAFEGEAALRVPGGGGTDFAPLLAEATRHRPDIAVVLTDLDGPAGARPAFPVVWAVPETARATAAMAPFGRVVVID